MMLSPIEINGLSKTFRGKKRKLVNALQDVSFKIRPGEVFGFLGPNGAGKSTTIKILMGQLRPTSGDASLFGIASNLPEARRRVGYLPENPSFFDFLTAREYLRFVGKTFNMIPSELEEESARVLKLLDLEAAADRSMRGYSKGMVQRLGIAQTLLHDPDLFILDEPMSGLDPIGRALVKEIILDLKDKGKTVFFSTHVTADIERVCDRVGVIINGTFQKERVVNELLREGIDGYFCRFQLDDPEFTASRSVCSTHDGINEVFIDRYEFDGFASELIQRGGSFDLIEPRRKDIEAYFLALVRKSDNR